MTDDPKMHPSSPCFVASHSFLTFCALEFRELLPLPYVALMNTHLSLRLTLSNTIHSL